MSQQPNLYRTPNQPGYLGAYNWRATTLGLLMLVAVNFAATQFVAAEFDYQPALGVPLVRTHRGGIYQPFAWTVWGWYNSTSQDPRIRNPLFLGEMIVFGGSFVCVGVFFVIANRRSRKLMEGAEDLHGSARWATEEDIERTGLASATRGVYVGAWSREGSNHLQYLRHNGPEHVLAFAPTRTGKGVALVIPTLLAWGESAVIYDIKGENWAKTAGFRNQMGHLCFKFSPIEEISSRFNPLSELRLFTLRDVSDAQNVADMIIRIGQVSPNERHWQDSAVSLTTGMVLHVCYQAALEGRIASLADISHALTKPGCSFRDNLSELMSFQHDPGYNHRWRMPTGELTATHPTVIEKCQQMLNKDDRELSGVLSTANTALALYSDPLVVRNTSASDFTVDDLVNHDRPIALYLVVPPSDKVRLRPLIRLIFTTVVNRLTERLVFEGSELQRNKRRLLLLIDEFPSLERMDVFADALSYMAGYGIKAYLITQDITQIVDAYGPNESIVSNCHVRIAFAPNKMETAELLSKMAGTRTVQKATFNFSGSRFSPVMAHVNASVDHVERPLMTPDEIMRIKAPEKVIEGDVEKIVAPGQTVIFVGGQFPILGTQLLYFFDPTLLKRSTIDPPTQFFALETGNVVPQPPADRTRNTISRAEVLPETEDSITDAERGFLEELRLNQGA